MYNCRMNEAATLRDDADIDDVPFRGGALFDAALLERMDENDWLLLKSELQEYLYRTEQTENPTYESASIVNWIIDNGEYFDRFYQHLREKRPERLLDFRKNVLDEDEMNDAEFIREWVAFRDAQ